MPAKRPKELHLDCNIHVRITAAEKQKLQEQADLASIGLSELIRRRALNKKVVSNTDLIMIRELRRIGGLLKHLHLENNGIYSESTSDALAILKTYLGQLSDDRKKG